MFFILVNLFVFQNSIANQIISEQGHHTIISDGQALQGNVTSFWQGLEYFGVGAISGAVTIFNPVLGRVINAGGNKIVQLANGQWSPTDIDSGKDVLFLAVDVGLDLLQPGMSNGLAKPIASSINRAIEKKAYEAFVKSLGKDVITSSWKGGFKVLGGTVELTSKAAANRTLLARYSGILRDAAKFKGNFGLGKDTASEAIELGRAWVGKGYKVASDGKTLLSSNGLRQFRPPSFKPKLNISQANFEWRNIGKGAWQGNGHLDIFIP